VSEDRGVKIESGWLAVLRASGGQSFAAAAGLGLFLWCNHRGWMPPLSPWMIQAAWLGMCIFTCLFGVGFFVTIARLAYAGADLLWTIRRVRKSALENR